MVELNRPLRHNMAENLIIAIRTTFVNVFSENMRCGMDFGPDETWMRVASPGLDDRDEYPVGSDCSITIDTGNTTHASIIQLNFTFMDVEVGEDGCVDYIIFSHVFICGRHQRMYTSMYC